MIERTYVGISGSRDYYPDDLMFASIERLKTKHGPTLVIVTGDANGVDECAIQHAKMLHVTYVCEQAKWAEEGKGAGHIRNGRIVARAESLLAFVTPKATYLIDTVAVSPGTSDAIAQALAKPIPVHVWHGGSQRWLSASDIRLIADAVQKKWSAR